MTKTNGNLIQKTTDYGIFKTIKGNRKLNKRGIDALYKSIKEHNILQANPIIVNHNMEIIDGQHRLRVAKDLKIPIYFTQFDPGTLSEIHLLNANMRAWRAIDFLESYITMGHREYIKFNEFWNKRGYPFNSTLRILASPYERKPLINHKFKEGLFEIEDIQESEKIADELDEILSRSDSQVKKSNRFYEAYFLMRRKDITIPQKLIGILVKRTDKIHRMETAREYLVLFEEFINKGNYGKRITLF